MRNPAPRRVVMRLQGFAGEVWVSTIGEELRQGREAKKLTLEDVQTRLGVPLHYLKAMENGGSPLVADEFYLVPFLRRYAEFLGRDPAATVAGFLSEAARGNEAAFGATRRGPPLIPKAWIFLAGAAVVVVVVLAGMLWQ